MDISPTSIVALDSMLFIYLLDFTDSHFHALAKSLFSHFETHRIKSITSIVSVLETLSSPTFQNKPEKIGEYSLFFQKLAGLSVFDVDWEIALQAATLRRENPHLKTPDSIQLATALTHHADIFITNDNRLKGLSLPSLKILPLSQIK